MASAAEGLTCNRSVLGEFDDPLFKFGTLPEVSEIERFESGCVLLFRE